MVKYLFIFLSLILISGLIFSGCSGSAATTSPGITTAVKTTTPVTSTTSVKTTTGATTTPQATSTGPQPVTGGTLRILYATSPRNLGDPGSSGTHRANTGCRTSYAARQRRKPDSMAGYFVGHGSRSPKQ